MKNQVQLSKLNNGLTVITDNIPTIQTIAINILIKVGSRHERIEQNGISHFLEHMAFKGTKLMNAQEIAESFDNIGGYINAYTSTEHTVYQAKILEEHTEYALSILADILQHSVFDPEEIEKERSVILQELASSIDTPDDKIYDIYQELCYQNQSVGRNILGSEETINKFNQENFKEYNKDFYFPENMIIAFAGNLNHDILVNLTEKYFNHLPVNRKFIIDKAEFIGGEKIVKEELEQVHLLMGFEGIDYFNKDLYCYNVLAQIMGGSMSSRLFQSLREKLGLVYNVYAFNNFFRDTGNFVIYSAFSPENYEIVKKTINEELDKAVGSISEIELNRVIMQVKANLLFSNESAMNRSKELVRLYASYDRLISHEEILSKYQEITLNDLKNCMETILSAKKALVTIGNLN